MDDLKDRAAGLQDKLSDLHTDFLSSGAQQAGSPEAADWQNQWDTQVRQVSEAQQALKSQGVGLHTADTLAAAEQAAGKLEERLQGLKGGQGSG